jgi:cation transport regulator ChaB
MRRRLHKYRTNQRPPNLIEHGLPSFIKIIFSCNFKRTVAFYKERDAYKETTVRATAKTSLVGRP